MKPLNSTDIMRRELIPVLIIALLMLTLPFQFIPVAEGGPSRSAATYIVDPNGNGDYTSIQDAVDAAISGDIIRIWNGTYYNSIMIQKTLILIGNGTSASIMDGKGTLDHQHLFHVSADNCKISGFQFNRSSPHHEFGGIGLYSQGNTVEENLFKNSNIGIYFQSSLYNMIRNNTFKWNIRGIRAEMGSNNNDFVGNLFVDNLNYGFYYERSGGSRIINNTFDRNRQSVMLGFYVHNLTFDGNVFTNNLNRSALILTYCLDSSVNNNTFTGNKEGVMIAMESHRNSVTWNNISENIEGVKIYKMYDHLGPCTKNVVNYNQIHNNSVFGVNASWTGGWTTNATNNWWGASTGPYHPTLNSPGAGDNVSDNVTFIPWLGGEPVNYPPIINDTGPLMALEDEEFYVKFNATDPEGDEISWEFTSDLNWLTWNPLNLSVIGMPDNLDVGDGFIDLTVIDPFNASDHLRINVSVKNTAPEIIGFDKPFAIEDMFYENVYTSTDDRAGIITWELDTNCSWLDIGPVNGTIFGTPRNEDVGICWVNISVDDGNGGIGFRNITLTIRNTNDAPIPLQNELTILMMEDNVYTMNMSMEFIDPDGDVLEFIVFHSGKIMVTIYDDGMLDLVPDPNWSGNENFTVYARDSYVEVPMEINVTVIPVNDTPSDPVITSPPGPYYENTTYVFMGASSDVDIPYGDELHFSWLLLPAGNMFNGSTVELNLTAGNYTLVLNVSDLGGAFSISTVDIEILSIPVENNTEPEPNGIDPDDDDEEPVDDDEEPVDDDEEPTDDDEEPVETDDDDDAEDESLDPLMFVILIPISVLVLLFLVLIFYLIAKRDSGEFEE